jgi:hypothetical protein
MRLRQLGERVFVCFYPNYRPVLGLRQVFGILCANEKEGRPED